MTRTYGRRDPDRLAASGEWDKGGGDPLLSGLGDGLSAHTENPSKFSFQRLCVDPGAGWSHTAYRNQLIPECALSHYPLEGGVRPIDKCL
jgi:hypothetical protein